MSLLHIAGGATEDKLDVSDVFSTYLYAGNGSTQTINNGINLADEGGLVWTKSRTGAAEPNCLFDSDSSFSKLLQSNTTSSQLNLGVGGLTATTTGYTINNGNSSWNSSSSTYASWTFRKAPRFFTQETINHISGTPTNVNLSILNEIGMVTVKATSIASNWYTWHRSLTVGNNLKLNLADAQSATNAYLSVSGTTLTVSASTPSATYIVYAWAHDPLGASGDGSDSLIQCGSTPTYGYVELGFEPQYVLYRRFDGTSDWAVADINRGFGAGHYKLFRANTIDAEVEIGGGGVNSWITPTGFYCSGFGVGAYIYMAIRRSMKEPTTSDEVFAIDNGAGTTAPLFQSGFTVDFALNRDKSITNDMVATDRLRQGNALKTNLINVEYALSASKFDYMNGWNSTTSDLPSYYSWMWKRAKGFFDVVAYTGNGVAGRTVNHNLGVVPELMIVKQRDVASDWWVLHYPINGTLQLNNSYEANSPIPTNLSTGATTTMFLLGNYAQVNGLGSTYIAYLFATLTGISKVGSFTGNGSSQTINCGFSTGAKFVLIKRADSTGDWYIWDSVRGIVAANDPHLSLNTTVAEVTTDDSIDPDSSGFIINQNTATNINVSGGSYIYYAIAN